MSFTTNIPTTGQTLGNSRTQVLNNFASLRTTLSNLTQPNHIDVNDAGAGKHIFVQMPVQTTGAANLPAANEGGLITRQISSGSELFYARDAVATYYQMTGPVFTGQGILSNGGTTMLFGGIIFKWGATAGGATLFATECGSAFPNNCFLVLSSEGSGTVSSVTATGFTSAAPCSFIALGN